MIDAFVTALGTALTSFVTDVSDGIGSATTAALPVTLGIAGIFLVYKVARRFLSGR